ncbi:hypothetical protein [Pseudomonas sp. RT6P73]
MSSNKSSFGLEIMPKDGGFKNGFTAVAEIGAGDFIELALRYRLPGADFYSFKLFDSDGSPTTCTVLAEDVKPLWGKKPKFYAVARFEFAEKQESNEVEVDLS